MRNFKISVLCVLLILCMSACGGESELAPNESLQEEIGAVDNEPEEPVLSSLPPDLEAVDMNGKEMTLVLLNWHNYAPLSIHDIEVEELTGDGFNDTAYNRNKFMEETFNCEIKTVAFPTQDSIPSIRNQIRAGDDTYDIIFFRAITSLPLVTGGYLHDLSDMPHVNWDGAWWDNSSIDAMSLGGRSFSLVGDYSMTVLSCVWLTYFNKELVADFALDDPYILVRDGGWTLNKMYEMGKQVAADLNGDMRMDVDDRFGFIHIDNTATALFNGFGEKLVDIGEDGYPYISLANQSAIEKFMHIAEILSDHDVF